MGRLFVPTLTVTDELRLRTFLFFVAAFGIQSGQDGFDPKYDLNNDGTVGFSDFLIFVDIYSFYTQQGT